VKEIVGISMIAEYVGISAVSAWKYKDVIPWEFIDPYGARYISLKNIKKVIALINTERKRRRTSQYEKVGKANTKRANAQNATNAQREEADGIPPGDPQHQVPTDITLLP